MNMNMNRLPVPTWNHLGVNFAPDKAALPQVPANGWGTAAATAAVPAGIRTNGPEIEIFETFTESGCLPGRQRQRERASRRGRGRCHRDARRL